MKHRIKVLFVAILLVFCCNSLFARYIMPVIQKVPVYRLVLNMEKQKEKNPEDPHIYYALGRLYAMSYAKKTDSIASTFRKGEEDPIPYYGFDPNLPHFFRVDSVAASDSLKKIFALESLERAITNFEESLKHDPDYIPALLGLAWSFDQKGDTTEAIIRYRALLKMANKKGNKAQISRNELNETSHYLIKLLDAEHDKEEIAELRKSIENYKPDYMLSPLLIPLEENIAFEELIDTQSEVSFNLDGTGAKKWEWISPKAGWLVYLNHEEEKPESGFQLFGNVTFNIFWDNGFQALSSLDDNQNGLIDASEMNRLAVWQDKNSNGICEKAETKTMNALEIISLNYSFEKVNSRLLVNKTGAKHKNGKTIPIYDWFPLCKEKSL